MTPSERSDRTASRRTFLVATAGGAAGLGIATSGRAQETGGRAATIRLGGEVSAWHGRAPEAIQGEDNPTLPLQAGETYKLVWENVDGQPHNVVIIDSNGNELERTEVISGEGATQTLQFTATPEMAEYYCEVHPSSMRGGIEVEGNGGGDQTTTPGNQTQTETTQAPENGTTPAETTTEGPRLPQNFESRLDFTARRFAETMGGSLDYSLLKSNLDRYRNQLSAALEGRNVTLDSQPSFRQVGKTGLAIESTLDGAGFYASVRQFYPEMTPEYVAKVARSARNEQAVKDVLAGVPMTESPDALLQRIERRSESVAASLAPQYAQFAPMEGVVHGGLLAVKDAGRLLRLRQNVIENVDACISTVGEVGAGFLLVGRSIQGLLRSGAMTRRQTAIGVFIGAATMALGDRRMYSCLRVNVGSARATTSVGNDATTSGNETAGTTNAGSLADSRTTGTASAGRRELGALATFGGCASFVGRLLSSRGDE